MAMLGTYSPDLQQMTATKWRRGPNDDENESM
jgi:hypothetical protein